MVWGQTLIFYGGFDGVSKLFQSCGEGRNYSEGVSLLIFSLLILLDLWETKSTSNKWDPLYI